MFDVEFFETLPINSDYLNDFNNKEIANAFPQHKVLSKSTERYRSRRDVRNANEAVPNENRDKRQGKHFRKVIHAKVFIRTEFFNNIY